MRSCERFQRGSTASRDRLSTALLKEVFHSYGEIAAGVRAFRCSAKDPGSSPARFLSRGLQLVTRAIHLSPDMIVVYHAINDVDQVDGKWLTALPAVDYTKHNGLLENCSLLYVFFRNAARPMIEAARGRIFGGSSSSAATAVRADMMQQTRIFRGNLEHFAAIGRYRNIKVVFVTMPLNHDPSEALATNRRRARPFYAAGDQFLFQYAKVEVHNAIIRDIAQRDGAYLVDIAATGFGKDPDHFVDLCHFSELGAEAFAKQMAAALREWLPAAGSPRGY